MKPKAHILIVEDHSLLYKRMSLFLKEHCYSVSDYTPSYEEALINISKRKPDIALLDIDLQGENSGFDLGKKIKEEFDIPFIYVTNYNDDETFYKGLATQHEHYLVKTKPHLDTKELIRAIQTVLAKRQSKVTKTPLQKSILCYPNYINELKQLSKDSLSEIPVCYEDITKFTTKNEDGEKLKPNYVRVETFQNKSYFLPVSLTEICKQLPLQFIRINESEIVNLSDDILTGRINGSRLKIGKTVCHISKTYKAEVENRIALLYQRVR